MAAVAPLIVITGPTASGKTGLAIDLALKWGGEIICADSRTVYAGMDIGTAKPTKSEQEMVRHWGLDCVRPGERFTVDDFQRLATAAIDDIRSRGKIPFLVGGTGLYIDAVVLNFVFGPDADTEQRNMLEKMTTEQLISLHQKQRIPLPKNEKNRRHLVRSVEKNNNSTSRDDSPEETTFVFAVQVERALLRERIRMRVDAMFANNIVYETQRLLDEYGRDSEAMTGNIYRIVRHNISGEIDEATAKELCAVRDWQLAKRQMTWLRRHDFVRWLASDDVKCAVEAILQKHRDA